MQLAGTPSDLDLAAVNNGDSSRIVSPIFQPPEPFDHHRDGLLIADISDYSAHNISSEDFCARAVSRALRSLNASAAPSPVFDSGQKIFRQRRRAASDARPKTIFILSGATA
jgi:hypothetical protein